MTADAHIMEALARLEHKLDVAMNRVDDIAVHLMKPSSMQKVGSATHVCPLCHQNVEYYVDINDSVVVRRCGCSTGKIALDMKAFSPPNPIPKNKEDNEQRDPSEEDRSHTYRRGPYRGR